LAANFSLELGVPAAWKMLALGLAIALAAALRPARKRTPGLATHEAAGCPIAGVMERRCW